MTYDIDTVPKSYQRLFGTTPKEIEPWKTPMEVFTRPLLPEIVRQKRQEYERWTSNVWNTWILQVSEEDKIKYRMQDLQEKYN